MKISTGLKAHFNALGAEPMFAPFEQCYDGLKKGVFDGIDCANAEYVAMKFAEVAKYKLTNLPNKAYPIGLAMNLNTWNSLPSDIQTIFAKHSGANFADMADAALAKLDAVWKAQAEKMGAQFITLSQEEVDRWTKAVEPTRTKAAAAIDAKGLPGTAMLKAMDELIAKYSD